MITVVGYQKIYEGKWEALAELNKRWDDFEERLGFPPEKRCRCQFGGHDSGTILLLREWESMSAMEATYAKAMADPKWEELWAGTDGIIESGQWEIYMEMP